MGDLKCREVKTGILPTEINANRYFRGSHGLKIQKSHLCPSMGGTETNAGSVAMEHGLCTSKYSLSSSTPLLQRRAGQTSSLNQKSHASIAADRQIPSENTRGNFSTLYSSTVEVQWLLNWFLWFRVNKWTHLLIGDPASYCIYKPWNNLKVSTNGFLYTS